MNGKIHFISAGAGSGKTFALTELMHRELSSGNVSPAGVLATTFTKRAATELRDRVTAHLIDKQAFELANQMSRARIGTVNSVCGSLLQRFAFEAAMPVEQTVLDEDRAEQLLREAIDAAATPVVLEHLMRVAGRLSLHKNQQGGRPPWQVALRRLIDQARANGIEADSLINMGRKNASNLLAHFPVPVAIDLDTGLAQEIARVLPHVQAAAAAGGKKVTATYLERLEDSARLLMQHNMGWADWVRLAKAAPEKGLQAQVQGVTDTAAQYLQHPRLRTDIQAYLESLFSLAGAALAVYAQLKNERGAVDFIDQERRLLDALADPALAQTLSSELELLLVDEFQDTSPIQLALFLKLADCAQKVVWVGDVKQAIYGFRGGDADLMRAVMANLPALGGSQQILTQSWRARPPLVQVVNQLFTKVFTESPADQVILRPTRADTPGAALADWILEGGNQALQYRALASGIARLMAEGREVVDRTDGSSRPLRHADIAVLAQSHAHLAGLAHVLLELGLPCSSEQAGLLATPEAVLALACLRRFNDPEDTLASAEILALADGLEPEVWLADRLRWLAQGRPPGEWMRTPPCGSAAGQIATALAALVGQRLLLSPREIVEAILLRCQLPRRVLQWQPSAPVGRQRLANLDQLLALATRYEDDCSASRAVASVAGLLLYLQTIERKGQDICAQPALNALQLLTHHGAKGLEWPVVILCDLHADLGDSLWGIQAECAAPLDVRAPLQGRFLRYWPWPFGPQKQLKLADDMAQTPLGQRLRLAAVNEAQRLLYVSMTRARELLVLARPAKQLDGEWMQTIALAALLPEADDAAAILLEGELRVPFERWRLPSAAVPVVGSPTPEVLHWFAVSKVEV
ncbi:UvrD-helicase domain-containing protein [Roseateles sp. GG27B]